MSQSQARTKTGDLSSHQTADVATAGAVKLSSVPMTTPESDEDLMCRYRDGDSGAFERLYLKHKGGLFRYFLRQCSDRAIAEELYQDVWMRVINSRDRYEVTAKFTTWVYRIAHNRLVDFYRQSSRQIQQSFDEEEAPDTHPDPTSLDPMHTAAISRDGQRLMAVVADLPPPQQEAFLLRQEGGLSLEEIAEATGVNRETAKSRLRYAMSKIRRSFEEHREVTDYD